MLAWATALPYVRSPAVPSACPNRRHGRSPAVTQGASDVRLRLCQAAAVVGVWAAWSRLQTARAMWRFRALIITQQPLDLITHGRQPAQRSGSAARGCD